MMNFLLQICLSVSAKDIVDSYVSSFSSVYINVDEEQIREITFDRNELTVIFPEMNGIIVEVYIFNGPSHQKITQIEPSDGPFAVHSGNAMCEFRLKSIQKATIKIDIIADSPKCESVFYSSRNRERFQISDSKLANISISKSPKICFMHSPNQLIEFNVIAQGTGYSLNYFKQDKEQPLMESNNNQYYHNFTDKPIYFVFNANSPDTEGTFQYITKKYNEGVSEGLVLKYNNTRDTFIIKGNKKIPIRIEDELFNENLDSFYEDNDEIDSNENQLFKITTSDDDPTPEPPSNHENRDVPNINPNSEENESHFVKYQEIKEDDHNVWAADDPFDEGSNDRNYDNDDGDDENLIKEKQRIVRQKSKMNNIYIMIFTIVIIIIITATFIIYTLLVTSKTKYDPYEALPLLQNPSTYHTEE